MGKATTAILTLLLATAITVSAQEAEFLFNVPVTSDFKAPYPTGNQSGARAIAGPFDLDGDGRMEVVLSDYSGGGRGYVFKNVGVDTWEWAYSTPWLDSTNTSGNARAIAVGDLDGDTRGEIIIFGGRGYAESAGLPPGLYVYEFNGTDFGDAPASIYEFDGDLPDRFFPERITVQDIDGDGIQEVLFGNNGSRNRYDNWYILSVTGDIGSGFEAWAEEARISSRASEDFDPVNRGGGSPYYIGAGDFNGDGKMDLSMHAWESFNLTTGRVVGPDTYEFPEAGAPNAFLNATSGDYVSLFGGVVVDIDGDGTDEVFYPVFQTGNTILVNYERGENTLEITPSNVIHNILTDFTTLGITAGDITGNGRPELIGSGPAFTAKSFMEGKPTRFVRIAEFVGTDVTDPESYRVSDVLYSEPFDTTAFNVIHRDSAGVKTTLYEDGARGPEFVSKLAYLGDPDGDGKNEVAIAFQGVDDSTFVFDEVYDASSNRYVRTRREAIARENRVFMRVLQGIGSAVNIVDQRIIMPSDYKLSNNYPNPFNPTTTFSFELPLDKAVSVRIYDVAGRLVKTLLDGEFRHAGSHEATWDGTNDAGQSVASGTYIYALEWGSFRQSKKMVLIK